MEVQENEKKKEPEPEKISSIIKLGNWHNPITKYEEYLPICIQIKEGSEI